MSTRIDTKFLEQSEVETQLNHLTPASLTRWNLCRSTHRWMAYSRKCLVVYKLLFDLPIVIDKLYCETASFDLDNGMVSRWVGLDQQVHEFSSQPVEVYPAIFLWHTYYTDVQYLAHKGRYSGRFSMLYRCNHHPEIKRDNTLYIQELASYEAEFNA